MHKHKASIPVCRFHGKATPCVAVIGDDPEVIASIKIIIGDICQIEHYLDVAALIDEFATEPPPALVLLDFDAMASTPGMRRRIQADYPAAIAPVFYVSGAGVRIGDDGHPLRNCLVTTSRPTEFRAIVESRLSRPGQPFGSPE